jgi:hypothetical protein
MFILEISTLIIQHLDVEQFPDRKKLNETDSMMDIKTLKE